MFNFYLANKFPWRGTVAGGNYCGATIISYFSVHAVAFEARFTCLPREIFLSQRAELHTPLVRFIGYEIIARRPEISYKISSVL
jgi:hypothetical protein